MIDPMKSVNEDNALWSNKKGGSINGIVSPSCCWVIGCCWYWYGMASREAAKPDLTKD
ncbi:MAG: hypothetical protein AABZ63_04045 [Actinomycetota bacterium]